MRVPVMLHRNSRNVEIFSILGMLGVWLLFFIKRERAGNPRQKDVGVS
jgi:hypothetical protein